MENIFISASDVLVANMNQVSDLCKILVEDTTSSHKLSQIKKYFLKMKIDNPAFKELMVNSLNVFKININMGDIKHMEQIVSLLKNVNYMLGESNNVLNDIRKVIKEDGLDDDDKISRIELLLI